MEKRTLIAFLLTIVVWGIWFLVLKPDANKPDTVGTSGKTQEQVQKETAGKQPAKKDEAKADPSAVKPDAKPVKIAKSDKAEEKLFEVSTEKFSVQLSSRGGAIKSLRLKERKNPEGGDLEVIVSKSPYEAKNIIDFPVHFSENEFMNGSELENAVWRSEKRPDGSVHFYTEIILDGSPVQVHKTYTFNEKGDDFHLEYKIVNKGKKELSLKERKIIFSPSDMLGPTIDYGNTYNRIQGICSVNKKYEQLGKGSGFFSKEGIIKRVPGEANWVGLMSRYLLLIMLPDKFSGSEIIADNRDKTGFRTGMSIAPENIGADSQMVKGFRIYLGEKDKDKLKKVSEDIVDAADVSKWIEPIRYFVMWSLLWLKGIVGNLGWALVIFSILTKIAFMPLTKKSTESMRKMQSLTPKIAEIKAKYKDKPDVIQQETMKLYKENKVNPLGGCLPVILQMPFFFRALQRSGEFRGSLERPVYFLDQGPFHARYGDAAFGI